MRIEKLPFPRVRDLRNDRDLTQAQVAKILYIGQKTYSRYEIGTLCLPLDALIRLAEFYGTSLDYLAGLTDEPAPYPRSKTR